MRARTATAAAGIVGSLLVSAVLWWHFQTAVFFLFVPFVPFLFRRASRERHEETVRECPVCGFRTTDDSYEYCPRDGTALAVRERVSN
jgi:membrane protein implicated in regulation of membrane protease activity